jgi:sugar phosphate isomerase/epimerase
MHHIQNRSRAAGEYFVERRAFLSLLGLGAASACLASEAGKPSTSEATQFQLACMTLPYSQFPFLRALEGIRNAGFRFVALGTTHREADAEKGIPILATDASPAKAREIGSQCRDRGLQPLMMFSMIYPEHEQGLSILKHRLEQAAAAGIPQVLTFGHTQGGNRALWIDRFKQLGSVARDLGVTLVVKQHGGETGTGAACAEIVREVNDDGVKVNYDAGNVMDYLNVDPLPDIAKCADQVRSMCLKDHRNWPKDEDCSPGLGEIDHYRLLDAVSRLGVVMPLCFENISYPMLPRPTSPEQVDEQAQRARQYIETVLSGLQRLQPTAPK